ncbi:hypothetical protein HanIR_Chr08g0362871 [Helianthus annuus]|nr:hypothetical protein HanIR_Chr08g0362871 [Helianthus annuus]
MVISVFKCLHKFTYCFVLKMLIGFLVVFKTYNAFCPFYTSFRCFFKGAMCLYKWFLIKDSLSFIHFTQVLLPIFWFLKLVSPTFFT